MRLEIRSRQFNLTQALRAHVEERLRFALGRFADRLGRVHVRLWDENGPKGGEDMHCSIEARGAGVQVRVDDRDADLYAAVSRAAERVSRTVHRAVERSHAVRVPRVWRTS